MSLQPFKEILREKQGRMFGYALGILGSVEDAKDVAATAAAQVYAHLNKMKPSDTIGSFLFQATRSRAIDLKRSHARRKVRSLDAPIREAGSEDSDHETFLKNLRSKDVAVLDQLEQKEEAECVHVALRQLPAHHAYVLALIDMQGMSYDETAKVLGVSGGTIRSRITRGRIALRRELTRMNGHAI